MIDTPPAVNAGDAPVAPPVASAEPVAPVAAPVVAPVPMPNSEPELETDDDECKEAWYKKMWRPTLAGTYIVICVFDFLIMPISIEASNRRESNNAQAVELALKFKEPTAQIQALKTFSEDRTWSPLTLMGGGMFHVAFGALLTGAAVTRGLEKKEHASKGVILR